MGMEFPRTSTIEAADAFVSHMAQMQEEAKATLSHAANEMARCRQDICVIPSPPLRAGFGPKTREYNRHSFDLYISHFFTIYKMSQIPSEVNRLETPDLHDSDGPTYVRIRAL